MSYTTYDPAQLERDYQAQLDYQVQAETEAREALEDLLPSYSPHPTCGQCEHLIQSTVGFCPLAVQFNEWGELELGAVRKATAKPCRLYKEDCPF